MGKRSDFSSFLSSYNQIICMSSILGTSQGVVLATAMAAVSGTVIILAFRLQKTPPRPSLSSSSSEGKRNKKSNKRVHFAEDVVDPRGDGVEFRKRRNRKSATKRLNSNSNTDYDGDGVQGKVTGMMPANRVALYSGMLRDRVGQRFAYSC